MLNNKLNSEKYIWKEYWTGVRIPSSPPITNLCELQIQNQSKMVDFFVCEKSYAIIYAMAKLMEMENTEQNKIALYLFNLI